MECSSILPLASNNFRDMKILNKLSIITQSNDLSTEAGRAKEREKRIFLSAIWAIISKVINTAIPLITIKITIGYLGTELYGLWATITSFFALFAFADLGLGNGLQTELSRATGKDDALECKKIISSAYVVLTSFSVLLIAVFLIAYSFVDWGKLMGAESQEALALSGSFVMALLLSKFLGVPTSLVQRVHNALQEGYIASLWSTISSVASLITIVVVWLLDLGKAQMMWASSFIIVAVYILNTIIFFRTTGKPYNVSISCIDKTIAKRLLSTGFLFLVLSILTSVSLSFDSFIVTKAVGISETAAYSIANRIALFIGIISTMLSTPLWAANGEALERGDYAWVKSRTVKMTWLSFWGSVGASVFLIILANPVLAWMGKDLYVSIPVLIGMCLTQILIATANPAFMVLNASRRITVQIIMFTVYSVISLAVKFYCGNIWGTIGISMGGAISYLIIIIPWVYWSYKKAMIKERNN